MLHTTRWTTRKLGQRLSMIERLVYRRQQPLPPFRYATLADPMEAPLTGADVDDSGWTVVEPGSYWGAFLTNFMLRGEFQVPADWDGGGPIALYLPLGDAGDFSHPEALVYVDGQPYATCDRYHQEIRLPPEWRDGRAHRLDLHGWTGLSRGFGSRAGTQIFIGQ